MTKRKIEIYTDGSCKGNPGPGGWAAIFLEPNDSKPFHIEKGNESHTTNNRMEMIAMIEALHFLREKKLQSAEINLYSDSNLLIQTLNLGWKKKANLDLWEELSELDEEFDVNYIWVKGHAQNKWNNECDKVAQHQADLAAKGSKSPSKRIVHKKSSSKQQELF